MTCSTCSRDPYTDQPADLVLALYRLDDGTFRCWRCAEDMGTPFRRLADVECDECRERLIHERSHPDAYPEGVLCPEHMRARWQRSYDDDSLEVALLTRMLRRARKRLASVIEDAKSRGVYIDEAGGGEA